MWRLPFASKLLVILALLSGFCVQPASGWDIQKRELHPLPTPPPITVAGMRIGFTRDSENGRIGVHFMEGFHPDHVDVLLKQKPLGTVFFSGMRQSIKDDDLKLLRDVPMTGLFLWSVSITDKGLEGLKGHAHLESILLNRIGISDACIDTLATFPKLVRISIDYGDVTDAAVAKVAALKQLTTVDFFRCPKITDHGVIQLAQLPSLQRQLGAHPDSRARRLFCQSRFAATPRHFLFELNADGNDYAALADAADEDFHRQWDVLRMVLEDAPQKLGRFSRLSCLATLGLLEFSRRKHRKCQIAFATKNNT